MAASQKKLPRVGQGGTNANASAHRRLESDRPMVVRLMASRRLIVLRLAVSAQTVQAERVQPTCPSAGSIGGAHLENQDQAVSVLEWRSSSRRSGFAAAEQRIEHEAGPRHARRLSKLQISRRRWRAAAGLGEAQASDDRG